MSGLDFLMHCKVADEALQVALDMLKEKYNIEEESALFHLERAIHRKEDCE